jgi:hypothetical protein
LGLVAVERTYFNCSTCNQGEFGADRVLGIDGYITMGARRMATLLGVQESFAKAELALFEVAGWELDDNTIRKLCHETAKEFAATREQRTTAESFARAGADASIDLSSPNEIGSLKAETPRPVDLELQIDAGKINTLTGWRDVKIAVFTCRERGQPITPAEWNERDLPAPSVRSVIAAVEESSLFGKRCAAEAQRLGIKEPKKLSVLGDGGEWIWNQADLHFNGAQQLLDYWHGTEYLSAAAKAVFGADNEDFKKVFADGKRKMREDGYWGITEWVGELMGKMPAGGDGAALGDALNYFSGNKDRLNYAQRLRRGQSIGSGLVEGTVKQDLNKRMKQTGARWKVAHVGPFVELGALAAGPEWQGLWANP